MRLLRGGEWATISGEVADEGRGTKGRGDSDRPKLAKAIAAQANGVRFGREPSLTAYQRAEALRRRAAGETLTEIARSFNVSHTTLRGLWRNKTRLWRNNT